MNAEQVRFSDCAHWESPAESMERAMAVPKGSPWDKPWSSEQPNHLGLPLGILPEGSPVPATEYTGTDHDMLCLLSTSAPLGYSAMTRAEEQAVAMAHHSSQGIRAIMDSVGRSLAYSTDKRILSLPDHTEAEALKDRVMAVLGTTTHTKVLATIHKGTTVLVFVRAGRAYSPKIYVSPKSTDAQIRALIELVTTLPLEI